VLTDEPDAWVVACAVDATVRVTLQLEHHGLVEFAFKKKCVYRAPKESVSFTANELLVMTYVEPWRSRAEPSRARIDANSRCTGR